MGYSGRNCGTKLTLFLTRKFHNFSPAPHGPTRGANKGLVVPEPEIKPRPDPAWTKRMEFNGYSLSFVLFIMYNSTNFTIQKFVTYVIIFFIIYIYTHLILSSFFFIHVRETERRKKREMNIANRVSEILIY